MIDITEILAEAISESETHPCWLSDHHRRRAMARAARVIATLAEAGIELVLRDIDTPDAANAA